MRAERLLAGRREDGSPLSLSAHRALHGAPPPKRRGDAAALQAALTDAAILGRGGGAFPAAAKLRTAHDSRRSGTVIGNAAEGEPASVKDQVLLGHNPHLVLDGLQLAARSVDARDAALVLHDGSPALAAVQDALAERDDPVRVRVVRVPDRYVSGEASAVARAAAGGEPLPQLHDERLAVRGPNRRPTVVLNAETLACLALFLLHGPAWFRQVGTPEEPGTVLLTVRAARHLPQVVEVALGTPLREVLDQCGLDPSEVRALLTGGYFGRWLPASATSTATLSHRSLQSHGGVLGAGVVIAVDDDACPLRSTAEVLAYLAGQSAGQCGPCVNGLPALAGAFAGMADGQSTRSAVDRYSALVSRRGLCHLPDGAAALAHSALTVFGTHVVEHRRGACHRPASSALALPGAQG